MYILIILLCVVFIYKITIRETLSSPNCGKSWRNSSAKNRRCDRDRRYIREIKHSLIPSAIGKANHYNNIYRSRFDYNGKQYYDTYRNKINDLNNRINQYNNTQNELGKLIKDTTKLQKEQRDLTKIHKSLLPDYIENKVHYGINSHDAGVVGI